MLKSEIRNEVSPPCICDLPSAGAAGAVGHRIGQAGRTDFRNATLLIHEAIKLRSAKENNTDKGCCSLDFLLALCYQGKQEKKVTKQKKKIPWFMRRKPDLASWPGCPVSADLRDQARPSG